MSVTEEEKQEIINRTSEKVLLLLPEVVGNLMVQSAQNSLLTRQFYAAHPEFSDKRGVSSEVIEMVEGRNPLDKYEEILKKAVPEIRSRINTLHSVDTATIPTKPDLKMHGDI